MNGNRAPQPIAAWSFEKIHQDVVPDVSGNGFDAVLHGGTTVTTGPLGGQALEFDGTGNYQAWWGQPQLNGLSIEKRLTDSFQEISIEAWICKQPGPWMSICYRDMWNDLSGFGLVADWEKGKIFFGHYDPYQHSYAVSETTVQDGTWHHIVGTMQPTEGGYLYQMYVDGKLDGQQVGAMGITATGENGGVLKIAYPNASGADNPYRGALDGIAIYGQALTPEQVAHRYSESKDKPGKFRF